MKPLHIIYIFILVFASCAMSGCSDSERVNTFNKIETRIGNDPKTAVQFVDSLNADIGWKEGMNAAERARFNLLRVKSADKAYVRHTSDSLIRSVLGYYEKHTRSEQYPEALYYGGRVYSDLGDSPTALRYFQQALDALPEKDADTGLRCRILSQTGRLLDDLRLYDEAIVYIKQLLEMEYALKDSVNVMYNLELLGVVYTHKEDYITADSLFRKSLDIAVHCDSDYVKREKVFIAKALLDRGFVDSALNLIRDLPDEITPKYKPQALSTAAEVYYRAEKYDTAVIYAKLLVEQNNSHVLGRVGYNIIFKPELIRTLPNDILYDYIQNYVSLTNEYLQRNSNEFAAIQNSKFNYHRHDEARAKAEKEKTDLNRLLWIISTLFFAFVTFAVMVRNRKQKELISLQMSLVEFEKIKNHYLYKELIKENSEENTDPNVIRDNLRKSVISLYEKQKSSIQVLEEVISGSEVYLKLRNLISESKSLRHEDEKQVWAELEEVILQASPNFKKMLTALVDGSLSKNSIEIAMLIRCHFTPKEISILLGRAKNSISTRRQVLRSKIFENINDNEILDGVIWLL